MTISTTKPTLTRVPASVGAAKIVEIMNEEGGVVIENFLSPEELRNLNADMEPHLARIPAGGERTEEFFKEFHGAQTKRMGHLTRISPTFRHQILNKPLLHGICEAVFRQFSGDYWMTTATTIEIGPGNVAQMLHRDQVSWPIFDLLGKDGPEALINFFIGLTEFTDLNGATRVIPGSNKDENFAEVGTFEQTVPAEMSAGDCFLFSGKTVHGGGANRTEDFHRRGLSLAFQAGYLTPEETHLDVPREIVESMTPLAQKMIGWRSIYPPYSGGLWQINFDEMAKGIQLKANQPLK
ncbi:hypothetical protein AbraIFM66950_005512 [Aspergillus brasiliensis]|nr:hypothetical protein AbraIFM66950_005512 [Aspergillus brasiliensis]